VFRDDDHESNLASLKFLQTAHDWKKSQTATAAASARSEGDGRELDVANSDSDKSD
jgi:hypothetical protein